MYEQQWTRLFSIIIYKYTVLFIFVATFTPGPAVFDIMMLKTKSTKQTTVTLRHVLCMPTVNNNPNTCTIHKYTHTCHAGVDCLEMYSDDFSNTGHK